MPANDSGPQSPRNFQSPNNDFLAETMAQIEERTMRNPLAAVAIAAGTGFLLSKMRADKLAWRIGLFPAIAGAAAGYLTKR
jgi:uncharacterized protein YfiM (DUF2279 family)